MELIYRVVNTAKSFFDVKDEIKRYERTIEVMEKKTFELPNAEIDTDIHNGFLFESKNHNPLRMVIEVSEDGDVIVSELSAEGMSDRLKQARQLLNYLLEEYLFFEIDENVGFTCSDTELKERMNISPDCTVDDLIGQVAFNDLYCSVTFKPENVPYPVEVAFLSFCGYETVFDEDTEEPLFGRMYFTSPLLGMVLGYLNGNFKRPIEYARIKNSEGC